MKAGLVLLAVGIVIAVVSVWCASAENPGNSGPAVSPGVDAVTTATKPKGGGGGTGGSKSPKKSNDPSQPQEEGNIAEAVFRYQFGHVVPSSQKDTWTYFIGFGSASSPKDPDADFMKLFASNTPAVKAASACLHKGDSRAITDKTTAKPGILFTVEKIHWDKKDQVQVQGGYYESTANSATEVYTVVQKAGKWSVTSSKKGELSS